MDSDDIEEIQGTKKYKLKMHISKEYYKLITGRPQKNIEKETSCQIIIPWEGSELPYIAIKGHSKESVISAKREIDTIISKNAQIEKPSTGFTHFISIPLTFPDMQEQFQKFKSEILSRCDIDETLFQNPLKLHLTLTMLTLENEESIIECEKLLHESKENIFNPTLQGEPLQLKVCGLDSFKANRSRLNIVFGKIISERLQEIANEIAKLFASRGFSKFKNHKLHLTLMNASFRKDLNEKKGESESEVVRSRSKRRGPFDATKIFEEFGDYNFGEFIAKEIHISKLKAKAENGYYESNGILLL